MTKFKKLPSYGKPLVARRKLGERIGLMVVAVHDWNAGLDFAARSGTARVVIDEDMLPHELDWSCAVALDCLIVGDVDESMIMATVTMLFAAGAASIWVVHADGVWRMERWLSRLLPSGFYATDGPVAPNRLGVAINTHRAYCLMRRAGVYGTKMFDAVRAATFDAAFGAASEQVQARMARLFESRRAA